MRFDNVIYLIPVTSSENDIGDPIKIDGEKRQVFAEKKSVRQSEFYQAAATGLKPELTFVVWSQEYGGESKLEYNGKLYNIIRTFEKNDREIELVCSGLVNGVM
jgi:SPP1 family predicted phage head-tail adaptor